MKNFQMRCLAKQPQTKAGGYTGSLQNILRGCCKQTRTRRCSLTQRHNIPNLTNPRRLRLIGKHFGVSYGPTGVWRLLVHDLGWSCQKPERRAIQRDEEYIAHWKKAVWPRLKKSQKTWRPSGFPRRKRIFAHSQPS